MDLSMIQDFIPDLASFFQIDPATALMLVTIICVVANILGRLIPDDKTGFWGSFRDLCKIVGAYTPNRVTNGVSVNDVARSIVTRADPNVVELAKEPEALIPEAVDHATQPDPVVVPAFPGFRRANEELNDAEDDSIGGSKPVA